jgi:hypothetical protein
LAEQHCAAIDALPHQEGWRDRAFIRTRVRIAIGKGDFELAASLLGEFVDLWDGDYPLEIQFVAEVRARFLMMSKQWVPSDRHVEVMYQMLSDVQPLEGADDLVLTLAMSHSMRGERERVVILVDDYVRRIRRGRFPLSAQLTGFLLSQGIRPPSILRGVDSPRSGSIDSGEVRHSIDAPRLDMTSRGE